MKPTQPMLTQTSKRQSDWLPILTFSLGGAMYALLIDDVVEVEAMVELIPVQDAPAEVLGLVNRHGAVLPLIDLRLVFKRPVFSISSMSFFIVATYENQLVGLAVDEIHQVEYVNSIQIEETLASGKYIRGMINLKSQLIPLIALAPVIALVSNPAAG